MDYENRDEEIVDDINHKIKMQDAPPPIDFEPISDSDDN